MINTYFNRHADTWDRTASEKNTEKLRSLAQKLALKPGMVVLDVGTGTGVFLPYLMDRVQPWGKVVALDIADRMLARAKVKLDNDGIDYTCACIRYAPFKSELFDAVVCYSSFPHFPNKPEALVEIRRILKKSGRVFVCHTSSRAVINGVHHRVAELRHDMLPGEEEMRSLLEAAGYQDILVEDGSESYFASGRKPD